MLYVKKKIRRIIRIIKEREKKNMGYTWKNRSKVEKCVTLGKMGHNCKNWSHE